MADAWRPARFARYGMVRSQAPRDADVVRRYLNVCNAEGRPFFLPFVDEFQEQSKGHPAGCAGPPGGRLKYACGKWRFCLYCSQRKAYEAGIHALTRLMPAEEAFIVEATLAPQASVEDVAAARTWFLKQLHRYGGFQHHAVWIQSLDDQHRGVARFAGLVGGKDTCLLEDGAMRIGLGADGQWPVDLVVRRMAWRDAEDKARQLFAAGHRFGQPFDARRAWAGLYNDGEFRIRWTNVAPTAAPGELKDAGAPWDWATTQTQLARVDAFARRGAFSDRQDLDVETWAIVWRVASQADWYRIDVEPRPRRGKGNAAWGGSGLATLKGREAAAAGSASLGHEALQNTTHTRPGAASGNAAHQGSGP